MRRWSPSLCRTLLPNGSVATFFWLCSTVNQSCCLDAKLLRCLDALLQAAAQLEVCRLLLSNSNTAQGVGKKILQLQPWRIIWQCPCARVFQSVCSMRAAQHSAAAVEQSALGGKGVGAGQQRWRRRCRCRRRFTITMVQVLQHTPVQMTNGFYFQNS